MVLDPRTRLGPYEIVGQLGAGGMGVVYRARDTRLDRIVAIKVLRKEIGSETELRQRFDREARAVSSLSHPHVCALYDVGHVDGMDYLVMEFLEGETLEKRLESGALNSQEVLRFAVQIASALDRAHRQGLVHRDLKPGNVMLTRSGAKLLDFGLAKSSSAVLGGSNSVTQPPALTREGVIVGTLRYMAPEQLRGIEADVRSDVFAFGTVLYEALTGSPAFPADSSAEQIASILNDEPPPPSRLAPQMPAALERAIQRCLAKDPEDRWQNARDLMHELEWIQSGAAERDAPGKSASANENASANANASRGGAVKLAAVLAGGIAVGFAAGAVLLKPPEREPARRAVLSIARPRDASLIHFNTGVLSPDGSRLAFVGFQRDGSTDLWIRTLDDATPVRLEGTSGAQCPFWSPNGRSVGFFAQGKLMRIDAVGGPALVLCDAQVADGAAWSASGAIVFGGRQGGTLWRVGENGGAPVAASELGAKEEAHRWPSFLADGVHFVFLGDSKLTEEHHLKVGALDSLETTVLIKAISRVQYARPGHLLYVRGGELLSHALDERALQLAGDPVAIASGIVENGPNHQFEFSASDNGVLCYRSADMRAQLAWMDRSGERTELLGEPGPLGDAALSPDGKFAAYLKYDADGRASDVWTLDLSRGAETRLTFDPVSDFSPAWSPEGDRIAFGSHRSGNGDIYVANAFQPGEPKLVFTSDEEKGPVSWSGDGKQIFFDSASRTNGSDLWAVTVDPPGEPRQLLVTPMSEFEARLSPDQRWLAYTAFESDRTEVFLQPNPTGRRVQVSAGGASHPYWSRDGSELFFLTQAHDVAVASIEAAADLNVSAPRRLFSLGAGELFGVSPDAQRLLVLRRVEDPIHTPLTIVLDWQVAPGKR